MVEGLFKKILSAHDDEDFKKAASQFDVLRDELLAHAHAEDAVFYEPLMSTFDKEDDEELIREAKEEHHVVELLINEISQLDSDDDQWKAKVIVLKEVVEHHVEEEEEDMFKKAKKVLSIEEAKEIGSQMLELKESMKLGNKTAA